MAFYEKIESADGIIGIWEINESSEFLLKNFSFSEFERVEFSKISNEKRKKEFLIVRILLEQILNFKPEIGYENSGKPFLKNSDLKVSISHSAQLVVVFLSEKRVGIDVENLDRNIDKVAGRFLHKSEIEYIKTKEDQHKMKMLIWCAKEAIFKCSTEQGIQFNEQLIIQPFNIDEKGVIYGQQIKCNELKSFKLDYFFVKNNGIVFCIEVENNK